MFGELVVHRIDGRLMYDIVGAASNIGNSSCTVCTAALQPALTALSWRGMAFTLINSLEIIESLMCVVVPVIINN